MKKKVALLLALVMTLSLLPMNVFGAGPGVGMPGVDRPAAQFARTTVPHWDIRDYVVSIDLAALTLQPTVMPAGQVRRLFLEFEVTGGNSGIGTLPPLGHITSPTTANPPSYPPAASPRSRGIFRQGPEMWISSPAAITMAAPIPGTDRITGEVVDGLSALNYLNREIALSGRYRDDGPGPQYQFARVSLDGLLNLHEVERNGEMVVEVLGSALTTMGGWLEVHLPIRAEQPDAYLAVRLRYETLAGVSGTVSTLVSGPLTGGWANGVEITSRGVVPMGGNMARLNAIRIQEQAPGRLAALNDGTDANRNVLPNNAVMTHIVRLEAPRGFRWDVGHMFGLYGAGGQGTLIDTNSHAWAGVVAPNRPTAQLRSPLQDGAPGRHIGWINPVTDLHEIFIELSVPRRGTQLGAASTLAHIDIVGLSLVALPGAPTTGDVAVDVTVGTLDPDANRFGGLWNQQGLATWQYVGAVAGTQQFQTVGIYDYRRTGDTVGPVTIPNAINAPAGTTMILERNLEDLGEIMTPRQRLWTGETLQIPTGVVVGAGQRTQPHFGMFPADHGRAGNWRNLGLVVATRDHYAGVRVEGPATPAERISGRTTAPLGAEGADRWLHGGNASLTIIENHPGALFDVAQPALYELRPVTEGVRIVDTRARFRRAGANLTAGDITLPSGAAWGDIHLPDWQGLPNNVNFISSLTAYESGSVFFAPRSLPPDREGRVRSLEVGLLLSIEAGFEHHHGGVVEIEVFRNNVYVGTAHVANATDPIIVEVAEPTVIYRNQFDVIAMTPVSSFTITETAAGALRNNDELWFYVQATQDGRPVNIPQGNLTLFLGEHSVNAAESNMTI
jgi:hypothetical protein